MSRKIRKAVSCVVLFVFFAASVKSPAYAQMTEDRMPRLPAPGAMVHLSPGFIPAHLQGIIIHPDNALQFDFLIHRGDSFLDGEQKKKEYRKLVKYFLASLTIPDEDQWVNLSPYEKDRIIKDDFGKTEMGRDLLAEDYLLKQITSSLMDPQGGLGKNFWDRVYERAWKEYGTSSVPVNTFNKVWIVPDQAIVYESGNTAFILKSHLKVMLEEDYLSLKKHVAMTSTAASRAHAIGSQVIREIILPELEREVNEGKNFAELRQMYSGMVLATWYKKVLKDSLLGMAYADQAKVKGVDQDPMVNQEIYRRYIKAFKKGVFNYIKEDVNKYTNESIPRKYFSGGWEGLKGAELVSSKTDFSQRIGEEFIVDKASVDFVPKTDLAVFPQEASLDKAAVVIDPQGDNPISADAAMTSEELMNTARQLVRFFNLKYSRDKNLPYFYLSDQKEKIITTWIAQQVPVLSADEIRHFEAFVRQFVGNIDGAGLLLAALENFLAAGPVIPDKAMSAEIAVVSSDPNLQRMIRSDLKAQGQDVEILTVSSPLELRQVMEEKKVSLLIIDTRTGWISPAIVSAKVPTLALSLGLDNLNGWKRTNTFYFDMPFSAQGLSGKVHEILPRDAAMVNRIEKIPPVWRAENNLRKERDPGQKQMDGRTEIIEDDGSIKDFGSLKAYFLGKLENFDTGFNTVVLKVNGRSDVTIHRGGAYQGLERLADTLAVRAFNKRPNSGQAGEGTVDKASLSRKGGIDLNSANMNLQIKRDGRGVPLPLDQQDMARLGRIQGFEPEIIEIKPAVNLPILSELRQELHSS
jgi:hypothetical protein